MSRRFDHVDLRARSLAAVRSFYETLLPALGFDRDARIEGWIQFESAGENGAGEFFGVTESPGHVANECRIAFRAASVAEEDRLAQVVARAGGRNIEGPACEVPGHYALFFEDPSGNRYLSPGAGSAGIPRPRGKPRGSIRRFRGVTTCSSAGSEGRRKLKASGNLHA